MIGVPGIAQRLFGALKSADISVMYIAQASSEHSICFATKAASTAAAKAAVQEAFFYELKQGMVSNVSVIEDCSIIAAVGESMSNMPGYVPLLTHTCLHRRPSPPPASHTRTRTRTQPRRSSPRRPSVPSPTQRVRDLLRRPRRRADQRVVHLARLRRTQHLRGRLRPRRHPRVARRARGVLAVVVGHQHRHRGRGARGHRRAADPHRADPRPRCVQPARPLTPAAPVPPCPPPSGNPAAHPPLCQYSISPLPTPPPPSSTHQATVSAST